MQQTIRKHFVRWLLLCVAVLTGPGFIAGARAQLLTDDFPIAGALTDNGWVQTGSSTANLVSTSSQNLTYSGLATAGNSASLTTTGQDVSRGFTTPATGSVYASCLINVASAQNAGDYFIHFANSSSGTSYVTRVFVKNTTGGFLIGLGKTGIPVGYLSTVYSFVTTYFIVLKYTYNPAVGDDECSLFVSPVLGNIEPSPSLTDVTGADINVGAINLRQGAASSAPGVLVDYIRVGTTWSDVTSGSAALTANPTTLTGFAATQGQVSTPQVYTLTGSNLTASASVSASAGFEISTDGTTYASTATVPQTSSAISQTIAVRLTNAAPTGAVNGTITNASGSATATVAVSGNVTIPTPGKIVISQVYGGGGNSNAPFRNDFIELFNTGGTTIDISGWSVQYASSNGATWQVTNLTGSIPAGGYYLVQEAPASATTTTGVLLAGTDAVGNINMSATAGKVALVNVSLNLSGACPLGSSVVDFVGYGTTTSCFDGAGPASAPSNTNAVLRASNGCIDTDNNSADFASASANPRNSASPTNVCTTVPPNSPVLTATPGSLNLAYTQGSGPASTTVSVSGSNLNAATGTVTATSSSANFVVSPNSVPFSGSALTATTFSVSLVAGLTTVNSPYSATITFAGGGATVLVPVTGTVSASVAGGTTPIATARTQVGQTVTIQGTVTASGQLGNKQLYVEDNTGGVLVFSGSGDDYTTQTQIGDVVKLTGPVAVYQGGIEINGVTAFTLVSTGNPAPTPTPITLDQIGNYQGRLVSITGASVTPASPTFEAGNNTINADNTTGTLRIGGNSGLVGAGQPSAPFSITGIADRFVVSATTTGSDNIQLLPRQLSDIQGATAPTNDDVFCGTPIRSGALTQDQTFDFAAFNIEFFGASAGTINCPGGELRYQNQGPGNEALQAQNVKKVLTAINADVFVLEEVSDQNLLQNNLPAGYALSCSNRFSYYFQDECTQQPTNGFVFGPTKFAQKVCVAYNTTTVTSVSASPLLSDYYGYGPNGPTNGSTNNWSSGRLPYLFVADATVNGVTRRLNIIGIHAKSGSATADYTRRKQDVLDLYNLLTNSATGPGPLGAGFTKENIIIAGDYNDNITGSIAVNQSSSYKPFVDDAASFKALTQPLEDEQGCNTFFSAAGSTSFLDHILISNELFNAYVPNSVGIQTSFSAITTNFTNTTSDHRPVFARFDLSKIALPLSATLVASTSVCAGSPASFSLTVAGLGTGDTYSYTISNGTTSTTASGVSASAVQTSLVPTITGSFTATVLTSATASTTAASGNVAINALPTNASLSSGTLTCTATSVTLTASATGGTSYTLNSGPTSQTNTTGQFVVNMAGNYTAIIANASGCTATATATVSSNITAPTATLTASSSVVSSPTAITLTAGGGTSYTFSAGVTQIGATNQATVTQSGRYSVTVGNASGCTATASVSVTVNTAPDPTGPFAITGVTTVSCTPVAGDVNRRSLTFTPRYSGVSGQPISFSVVNEMRPTTAPGPYTLGVYVDKATITLSAIQSGTPGEATFVYNWLANCGTSPPANTAPTVANAIPNQMATMGTAFSYMIPANTFTDAETPNQLTLSVSGLPAGLSFTAPATISGTPSVSGTSMVTVTATDPGGLSASTMFSIMVSPVGTPDPTGPFAITGVTTVSCTPVAGDVNRRSLTFTPRYSGVSGQPISFSVVNEMRPTTAPGPYTLGVYVDKATITLSAIQSGTPGEATFVYNWLAVCGNGSARLSAEAGSGLQLRLLGNPVVSGQLRAIIRGAAGQALSVELLDLKGQVVRSQRWVEAEPEQAVEWNISQQPVGIYLLQAQTGNRTKTIRVIHR